jgi:hypothetical protein
MRALSLMVVATACSTVLAHGEERALTGAQIRELLPRITVMGEATTQHFSASGETTYTDHGRKSYGRWSVEGDLYCSTWPPNEAKSCHAVNIEEGPPDGGPATIIWINAAGERAVNMIEDKDQRK